jgi:hypothetical protein
MECQQGMPVEELDAIVRTDEVLDLRLDGVRALFYHDCSEEIVQFAQAHLRPQALGPFNVTLHFFRCPMLLPPICSFLLQRRK